jgi:hypothetical protein
MSDVRRDEIAMELEWLDTREAFVAAKATRDADPDGYAAAKAKMSEMRAYWRGIGEYLGLRTPAGAIGVTNGDAPTDVPQEG